MRTVQEIEQSIAAVKDTEAWAKKKVGELQAELAEARREPERTLAKELKRMVEVLEKGDGSVLSCNRRCEQYAIDTTYVVLLPGVFNRAEIKLHRGSLGSI